MYSHFCCNVLQNMHHFENVTCAVMICNMLLCFVESFWNVVMFNKFLLRFVKRRSVCIFRAAAVLTSSPSPCPSFDTAQISEGRSVEFRRRSSEGHSSNNPDTQGTGGSNVPTTYSKTISVSLWRNILPKARKCKWVTHTTFTKQTVFGVLFETKHRRQHAFEHWFKLQKGSLSVWDDKGIIVRWGRLMMLASYAKRCGRGIALPINQSWGSCYLNKDLNWIVVIIQSSGQPKKINK